MKKIELVKQHLLKGKPITSRYADRAFDYTRLASGINRLRKRGMDIKTTMIKRRDVCYAEYTLNGTN